MIICTLVSLSSSAALAAQLHKDMYRKTHSSPLITNLHAANSHSSSKAMATNKFLLKLLIDKKSTHNKSTVKLIKKKKNKSTANSHSSSKAMATNKLPLKLLIDKKSKKVLFGEANKEFIDFLFSLMSIPVGSLIKLLSKEKMVGCLGDLYGSIEELSDTYVQPNQNKHSILKTKSACFAADSTLLISNEPTKTTVQKYYRCSGDYYHNYITNTMGTACPGCRSQMNTEVTFVGSSTGSGTNNTTASVTTGGGYVKGVVTYMVMDNLVVMPMSTISSITLLNQFKVQDVGALEEKVVYLGMDEGLELLNASLQSKTVLTDVFLSKKQGK